MNYFLFKSKVLGYCEYRWEVYFWKKYDFLLFCLYEDIINIDLNKDYLKFLKSNKYIKPLIIYKNIKPLYFYKLFQIFVYFYELKFSIKNIKFLMKNDLFLVFFVICSMEKYLNILGKAKYLILKRSIILKKILKLYYGKYFWNNFFYHNNFKKNYYDKKNKLKNISNLLIFFNLLFFEFFLSYLNKLICFLWIYKVNNSLCISIKNILIYSNNLNYYDKKNYDIKNISVFLFSYRNIIKYFFIKCKVQNILKKKIFYYKIPFNCNIIN